jgi:hypothetical protein
MDFNINVQQDFNIFGEDDDEILLNSIFYINQFEANKGNNINNNSSPNTNLVEIQGKNNHISANSTLNTNAAVDECSQNINFNISFSFNGNQSNEQKKEMSQKSKDILSDFISKEKKIVENKINFFETEDKKVKIVKIKELKNNFEKLELSLKSYFIKPFMRKNYAKNKFFDKFENNSDEEEKKINLSDEIDIDEEKKLNKRKEFNINNKNNINEI